MKEVTAKQAIDALLGVAPCPVIHSYSELAPELRPRKPSRSRYFAKRRGKWAREQDFIYINEGDARARKYAQVLAHELGHALDSHRLHPAKHILRGSGRYRQELAAVAFEVAFMQFLGWHTSSRAEASMKNSMRYLNRYAPPYGAPSFDSVRMYCYDAMAEITGLKEAIPSA